MEFPQTNEEYTKFINRQFRKFDVPERLTQSDIRAKLYVEFKDCNMTDYGHHDTMIDELGISIEVCAIRLRDLYRNGMAYGYLCEKSRMHKMDVYPDIQSKDDTLRYFLKDRYDKNISQDLYNTLDNLLDDIYLSGVTQGELECRAEFCFADSMEEK